MPDLSIDRCAVLLAAGLPGDALRDADAAIRGLERSHGQATKVAELLLTAARAALACADPQTALLRGEAARRLFRTQRRPWWYAHATFLDSAPEDSYVSNLHVDRAPARRSRSQCGRGRQREDITERNEGCA